MKDHGVLKATDIMTRESMSARGKQAAESSIQSALRGKEDSVNSNANTSKSRMWFVAYKGLSKLLLFAILNPSTEPQTGLDPKP